ncbi:MAG: selenoneine biosynthesis selenosugar synthase SenB [Burkholderiaceae bacterium]
MSKMQNTPPAGKPTVLIVTPALAAANNGNWRTAARWQRFLRPMAHVSCALDYQGQACDLMIALHARRSADSIARFAASGRPLILVLTGTDLYRDIDDDASAQRSLTLADRIVVLQACGPRRLPVALRERCLVIEQSAPALARLPARRRSFDMALVGHVRAEKDPMTAVRALSRLARHPGLRLRHVGRVDDPALGPAIRAAADHDPRIELLGQMTHGRTRRLIRGSRVLLLPSVMEGGANVLIEAVTSAVPVLASAIDGSIGLLGADYPGLFPVGDDAALAGLIERCLDEQGFLARLTDACQRRAPLFAPEREAHAVRDMVSGLLRP